MSNTNQNPTKEKALTKYDRKMQARKEAESRDKHSLLISRIIGILAAVAIIAIIIAIPVVKSINANREYIRVGNHSITEAEYEFFYNNSTNYTRQLYVYYGLLDTRKSLETQMYNSTTTFAEFFEDMALHSITQYFIMIDDASSKGIKYDVTDEYNDFFDTIKKEAAENNLTENEYIKAYYGTHTTKSNIKDAVKNLIIANQHYNFLIEQNTPSSEAVEAFYTEHQDNYDTIDYNIFECLSDVNDNSSPDEIEAAMAIALDKVADMQLELENGSDFAELCKKYASESQKATYEDEKACAKSEVIAELNSSYSEWLSAADRKANDVNVFTSANNNSYYLVEFKSKQRPDTVTASIQSTLADQKVTEFLNSVSTNYQIIDTNHNLYITNNQTIEDYSGITSETN